MQKKSGQTSMVLIVLIIIIFIGVGIFLLISSIKPEYDEYHNLYAHNILLSVLRKSTGYGGECDTISSTIACASQTYYRKCGNVNCLNLSSEIVPNLVDVVIKPTFDYCLIIEPENWTVVGGDRIEYGDRCDVVTASREKWTANEKILRYGGNINIKMVIAET
jgi:hypothetical protein